MNSRLLRLHLPTCSSCRMHVGGPTSTDFVLRVSDLRPACCLGSFSPIHPPLIIPACPPITGSASTSHSHTVPQAALIPSSPLQNLELSEEGGFFLMPETPERERERMWLQRTMGDFFWGWWQCEHMLGKNVILCSNCTKLKKRNKMWNSLYVLEPLCWTPGGAPDQMMGGTHKPQSANSGEVCPRWCCLIINGSRKAMTRSYSHTFWFCADSISQKKKQNTNSPLSVSSDQVRETQSCFKLDFFKLLVSAEDFYVQKYVKTSIQKTV